MADREADVPILTRHGVYQLICDNSNVTLVDVVIKKKPLTLEYQFQVMGETRRIGLQMNELTTSLMPMDVTDEAKRDMESSMRQPHFVRYLASHSTAKTKLEVVPSHMDRLSLFRAIANVCTMADAPLTPHMVRRDVLQHIKTNKVYYGSMVFGDVDVYVEQDRFWPSKTELMALSELYHLRIEVVSGRSCVTYPSTTHVTWPRIRLVCLASEQAPPVYHALRVVGDDSPVVIQTHPFTDELSVIRPIHPPYDAEDVTSLTSTLWIRYFRSWLVGQCRAITETTWEALWGAFNVTPDTVDAEQFPLLHALWMVYRRLPSEVTDHELRVLLGMMIRALVDLMVLPLSKEDSNMVVSPLYQTPDAGMGLTPDTRLVAWMVVPVRVESGRSAEAAEGMHRQMVQDTLTAEELAAPPHVSPYGRFLQYLYRHFSHMDILTLDYDQCDSRQPNYSCPLRVPFTDELVYVIKNWLSVDFGATLNERCQIKTCAALAHKGHFFLPQKWYTMESLWRNEPQEMQGPKIVGVSQSSGMLYPLPLKIGLDVDKIQICLESLLSSINQVFLLK